MAALAFTLLAIESAGAAETWEGLWAKTSKECRNREGPDSKTMIDLNGSENGRPAPLYDQYENHCRIDSHAKQGNVITLRLTCYEFCDDYKAKKNPRRDTITVMTSREMIVDMVPRLMAKSRMTNRVGM